SVTITVTNTGGAETRSVAPAVMVTGSGATLLGGPTPASADIPGGAAQDFTWSWSGTATSTLQFSGRASGADANSGQSVTANTTANAYDYVRTPAALPASVGVHRAP